MKFYVRTYGCQMNVADSNEMGRHLKANGLVETEDPDEASIFLVNTCTVRQHAEDFDFHRLRLHSLKYRVGDPVLSSMHVGQRHDLGFYALRLRRAETYKGKAG